MAAEEKFGVRDLKYSEWHRSLPHNHLMLDFDMLEILERTLFGIFSGTDEDGDDVCKCLFECKEIQYSGGYWYLPYIDRNQSGCLKSFCKRYTKDGTRNDIPFFVVCYSIDKERNQKWFVVHAVNEACGNKLKEFTGKDNKTFGMSENDYIDFLSFMIEKKIYRSGSEWKPNVSLIDSRSFKNSIVK